MHALAALALILALGGEASAADCSQLQIEDTVKIEPLSRYGLMIVPVTLDGVEKKFLFDTGGGLSAITRSTVEELGLTERSSNYHLSYLNGDESDSFVNVRDVVLGTAKSSNVQFQVIGGSGFAKDNNPFDGIFSMSSFRRVDIDLDFGAGRVNFFSPDHCEGSIVYWPHQAISMIPMTLEHGHINIPVTLDGQSLRATIDTGASLTTLNLARAEQKMGFLPRAAADAPGQPQDDPEHHIYFRRFFTLSFKGVTVENPMVAIRPLQFGGRQNAPLGSQAQQADEDADRLAPDMIIGMDMLRHLHIYIAVREQRLYVSEATPGESVLFKSAPQAANR